MQPFRPGERASDLTKQAKTAFQNRPGAVNTAALQAARAALDALNGSPAGSTPVGEALKRHIQSQLAKGAGMDAFLDDIAKKAKEELGRRKHLISGLQEMLRLYFTGSDKLFRLRSEVLQPARAGLLSTPQAWQRIDDIAYGRPGAARSSSTATRGDVQTNASSKSHFLLLEMFEKKFGNLYFAVNAKAEAAVVLGGGGSMGIGGMRHSQAFVTATYTVGLGLSADAQGALELSVSMQKPEDARKITFEVAAGAGYGVAGEVTVSLKPSLGLGHQKPEPPPKIELPRKPSEYAVRDARMVMPGKTPIKDQVDYIKGTQHDGIIFDYAFDGISVNIGAGAGADFSTSIAFGESILLRP